MCNSDESSNGPIVPHKAISCLWWDEEQVFCHVRSTNVSVSNFVCPFFCAQIHKTARLSWATWGKQIKISLI